MEKNVKDLLREYSAQENESKENIEHLYTAYDKKLSDTTQSECCCGSLAAVCCCGL